MIGIHRRLAGRVKVQQIRAHMYRMCLRHMSFAPAPFKAATSVLLEQLEAAANTEDIQPAAEGIIKQGILRGITLLLGAEVVAAGKDDGIYVPLLDVIDDRLAEVGQGHPRDARAKPVHEICPLAGKAVARLTVSGGGIDAHGDADFLSHRWV